MVRRDPPSGSAGRDGAPIRVLLTDDHAVMRRGLVQLLRGEADICVVGEAASGREAVTCARDLRPDVIVMDASMPDMSGIEATRQITASMPGIRVIGLSMHEMDGTREAMLNAGAEAYLTKDVPPEELLAAIRGG